MNKFCVWRRHGLTIDWLHVDSNGTHWYEENKKEATLFTYSKARLISRELQKEAREYNTFSVYGVERSAN